MVSFGWYANRFLTLVYLPTVNMGLLLAPVDLSYDWQTGSIPLIHHVTDIRNVCTLLFYTSICLSVGLAVARKHVSWSVWERQSKRRGGRHLIKRFLGKWSCCSQKQRVKRQIQFERFYSRCVWPRCPCRKKVVQRQVVVKDGCNPLTTRHSNSFHWAWPVLMAAEHGHRSTVVPVRMVMISIGLYGTRNKKEPANYARYIIDDPGPGVGGRTLSLNWLLRSGLLA